jgi:predicted ATP-binding protein involved in virulence
MRIDKLQINNFRKFKDLNLNFKPGVNILIGDNAAGKTSVLESLKILIGSYFYGINSKHVNSPSIHKIKDIQFLQDEQGIFSRIYPTQVRAEGKVFDEQVCWSRELRTAKGASTTAGLSDLKKIVSVHKNDVLPIVAFYSTARFNVESRDSSPYKNDERYAAYKNALNANSSISTFVQWFENQDRISYQYKERTYALNVVSDAIMNCLPNCKRVFYDAKLTDILIEDENNVVTPFSLMSEGYRLITSLIGDLAYRCAVLNSSLEADCLRETSGVVLIDDIEIHLHPSWQQRVVNDLHRTFPKIQFIISTHSPIVLSGVQANVIRL